MVSEPTERYGAERAPMLHARLLGGRSLRLGDEPVMLDSARAESLLAYLLLHRDGALPRERIAFLLWPDSTEPQARTNLRHLLHTLRRALPEADRFIEVRPRTLQWRAEAPLQLDVALFEQAIADGRLEDAVDAYAGELLEGSYDQWLLEERERLAVLYVDALERLVRRLDEQGLWSEAITYAERLLRQDPLREETYRTLMRLCVLSGDRARALRVYHVCEATLQRELSVAPSAATREAYESLLAREPRPEEAIPASPASPPLVGRVAERQLLTARWRAAAAGGAHFVLLTGEAGIGKSRLVEELRSFCWHAGAVTAEARSYAAEGAISYGSIVEWLRSERMARGIRRLERAHVIELARIMPELLAEVGRLDAPEPLPESEQRRRLFDAVARAILASGRRSCSSRTTCSGAT